MTPDHQDANDRLAPLYERDRRIRYACEVAAVLLGVVVLAACLTLIGMSLVIIAGWFR